MTNQVGLVDLQGTELGHCLDSFYRTQQRRFDRVKVFAAVTVLAVPIICIPFVLVGKFHVGTSHVWSFLFLCVMASLVVGLGKYRLRRVQSQIKKAVERVGKYLPLDQPLDRLQKESEAAFRKLCRSLPNVEKMSDYEYHERLEKIRETHTDLRLLGFEVNEFGDPFVERALWYLGGCDFG